MKYERLTIKDKDGNWQVWEDDYSHPFEALQTAIDKLAELEDKIENGTLIEVPCKVGDTVYFIVKRRHKIGFEPYIFIKKTKLTFYNLKKVLDGFNYTVFLTKAEAEKKLKELKGE